MKEGVSAYCDISRFNWKDDDWMQRRKLRKHHSVPLNIYEVHPKTWKQDEKGNPLNWRKLADALVPYVSEMGYTHIQLLPIMEHPAVCENGDYDVCGYFAPDSAMGSPKDFMYLVNKCHQNDIGIIGHAMRHPIHSLKQIHIMIIHTNILNIPGNYHTSNLYSFYSFLCSIYTSWEFIHSYFFQ